MTSPTILRLIAALLIVAFGLTDGGSVAAHTGFESSSPAQGEVVGAPVDAVTVSFTGEPTVVDDGFAALDATGVVRPPESVTVTGPGTFEVRFDPPLTGGEIGLRWSVQAADGHVIEGAFSFTVDSPTPTSSTTVTEPGTTEADITEAGTGADGTTTVDTSAAVGEATPPDDDDEVASAATTEATAPVAPGDPEPDATEDAPAGAVTTLDEFLDDAGDGDVAGSGRSLTGRLLGIPATALVVGGLAMLAWVFVGSVGSMTVGTRIVRGAAVVLAVGSVVEFLGSIAASGERWSDAFATGTDRATTLRFVGAVVVAVGLRSAAVAVSTPRSLSAATVTAESSRAGLRSRGHRVRWDVRASAPIALGVVMILVSYWFDGHTVTRGWAPLHALVNSVHLIAGSVWFAGVVMLALVARSGGRRGDVGVAELVVRFSTTAASVLGAVIVAGLAMAVMVLDTPSELWSTSWGRTLLVKSAAVGVVVALGAWNHLVLRPELQVAPDDPVLRGRLRTVVSVEVGALVVVLAVTAWLVAAAT